MQGKSRHIRVHSPISFLCQENRGILKFTPEELRSLWICLSSSFYLYTLRIHIDINFPCVKLTVPRFSWQIIRLRSESECAAIFLACGCWLNLNRRMRFWLLVVLTSNCSHKIFWKSHLGIHPNKNFSAGFHKFCVGTSLPLSENSKKKIHAFLLSAHIALFIQSVFNRDKYIAMEIV